MRTPFEFTSFNEVTVKGYRWHAEATAAKKPRAVVVLAHGMAETILRYQEFAEFLVANGMVVYGYSHRGHFETAGSIERLGYIGRDGWRKMAADLRQVLSMAKADCPHVPVFLFGHSMGSYVVRTYLLDHPHEVDGIVLSGTGYPQRIELQAAALVGQLEQLMHGDRPSKLLDKLSFGTYNKAFAPAKTPFDWLTSDPTQVEAYVDDPWCGRVFPASFFTDMTKGLLETLHGKRAKLNVTRPIPMLLMSGTLDPVGQMGAGVRKSATLYETAGYHVTLKLYEGGRHEMLNEVNRQQVFEDVLAWLLQH